MSVYFTDRLHSLCPCPCPSRHGTCMNSYQTTGTWKHSKSTFRNMFLLASLQSNMCRTLWVRGWGGPETRAATAPPGIPHVKLGGPQQSTNNKRAREYSIYSIYNVYTYTHTIYIYIYIYIHIYIYIYTYTYNNNNDTFFLASARAPVRPSDDQAARLPYSNRV